jgi:hypothetical protein
MLRPESDDDSNLHHEFRSLSLLMTMSAILVNNGHPHLDIHHHDHHNADFSGLNQPRSAPGSEWLSKKTTSMHQSSVMHAMTNILVLDGEVLAGMNYAGDSPHMPKPDQVKQVTSTLTDDDVVYRTDVENLKLFVTPNPASERDTKWNVEYRGRGCVRGPSGNCLWDKVKASNKGFYLIDANIR